ncbi:hypothetical protein PRIPAC_82441 [Pristionchus pacificus]|uniref:G protein-coupled receptor n=1 Tax=Pristionchus pacificus TaxID=54126 RepID=A0A2A6C277_PRIPA|nr:hypothetical protein PRIPAC_82441 [Pristionchus pacificus]|eukprot:PDM72274.1 G protein-coupled receptor [Pristionchus pacificus]
MCELHESINKPNAQDISQSVVGLLINGLIVVLLWIRKMRTGWYTYRVGMTFSAIHGVMIALLGILSCLVHLFNYQNYILVIYGPIAYLPRIFSDIAVYLNLVLIIGVWEFIPAPCILQYLALCKPYLSDTKRVIISYSLSVILLCFSMPHYTTFFGPPTQRVPFENVTRRVLELDVDDVYNVYGATLFATPPSDKAVINIAIFSVLPPYFIAYLIFIVCCVKISRMLRSFGIKLSTKTMSMQRSFLKMMIMQAMLNITAQGLLPLLVLSIPVGMFVTAMLSNIAMDKQTLVITFCIWALPIIQGGIVLMYVNGIGVPSSRNSRNCSKTTRNTTSVVEASNDWTDSECLSLGQQKDSIGMVNISNWDERHSFAGRNTFDNTRDALCAHIFSTDTFTMVFYGPIVYLPRIVSDITMFLALILTIGIWEFFPSSCLLQYLALCRPYLPEWKRIALSFTPSIMLMISSLVRTIACELLSVPQPNYTTFFAPSSQQPYFNNITRIIHDLSENDKFYAYGALLFSSEKYVRVLPMTNQTKKAVINIVIYVVLPSFSIAFLIFGWCCARIYKALKSFGIQLSTKTISMQRSFLIMLLMQSLLPLIVLSVPVCTFLYAILNGIAMEKRTLVITLSVWSVPIVQGAIALVYVNGMGVSSSRNSRIQSTSMKNTISVETNRHT